MAKDKFAGRPQIQVGDVVRVVGEFSKEESCHVVSAVRDTGVYSDHPNYHYNEEIVAVYRYDGRDFKCIWESMGYKLNRFEDAAAEVSTAIKNLRANVTSITAAVQLMEQNAKEAGDGKQ